MVLQSLFLALIGVVVAAKKEKVTLIFSVALLVLNFLADSFAIHFVYSGIISSENILRIITHRER